VAAVFLAQVRNSWPYPGFDTSQNHIVYSHCVGPTKVFGPKGEQNGYHIRTSHARVGAVVESLMPGGYMTTTIRTNVARRQMAIHQARSAGPLASEKGCRTKLIGEVRGDVGKLLTRWDYAWHRMTVYGDVKGPLAEFGRALGLEVADGPDAFDECDPVCPPRRLTSGLLGGRGRAGAYV